MTADKSPDFIDPDFIDLEALDVGPMLRHGRTATFAPNWKSVLLADASVGIVMIILGATATRWIVWVGWPIVIVGNKLTVRPSGHDRTTTNPDS